MPKLARAMQISACCLILSSTVPALAQDVSEEEARAIARDTYVYAYALLLNDLTWRQFSNFEEPSCITSSPST